MNKNMAMERDADLAEWTVNSLFGYVLVYRGKYGGRTVYDFIMAPFGSI